VSRFFPPFLIILQTVGLLRRVISSSRGLYLKTGQHKQNKYIHIPNIHALCGIRTHDPGFRVSEDSSCLRQLSYRDRLKCHLSHKNNSLFLSVCLCSRAQPFQTSDKPQREFIMRYNFVTATQYDRIWKVKWVFQMLHFIGSIFFGLWLSLKKKWFNKIWICTVDQHVKYVP
jgi:hypothetical protein